jgi:hypothetical protein
MIKVVFANDTINLFSADTAQAAAIKTLLASAWVRPDLLDEIDWSLPHRIDAFFQTAADVAKAPQLRYLIAGSATMDARDCGLFYEALNGTMRLESIPTDGSVVREIQLSQIEFDEKRGACHAI